MRTKVKIILAIIAKRIVMIVPENVLKMQMSANGMASTLALGNALADC